MKATARVLLALLISSAPVLAQAGGGTIRGHILPARGENDLPGIVMVRLAGAGIQQVTYASGNYFVFEGIRDGNYTLTVSASGREEVTEELPGFSSGRSDFVTITMGRRTAEKDVPPEGNTVVDLKTLKVPNKAQEHMHKGLEFLYKTEFDKAAQHFRAAIKICPEFYQAHNNLGVASLKLNRLDEAEKEFARSVEIKPDNLIGLKNLGYVRMNRGRYREAIDPLSKALRLDTNDAKTEMYLGEAFLMEKDFANAKDHMVKAILLDPTLAHAYYRLGYIFLDEKQFDQALKHFREFLKLGAENGKQEVQVMVSKLEQHFKDSLARVSPNPIP